MENSNENFCYYSGLPSPLAYVQSDQSAPPEPKNINRLIIDRIIEMAWEDRTTFDAIKFQFGLNEHEVKALMKKELKLGSYKLWRKRVESSRLKHAVKRSHLIGRFKSTLQRSISQNKISKRK